MFVIRLLRPVSLSVALAERGILPRRSLRLTLAELVSGFDEGGPVGYDDLSLLAPPELLIPKEPGQRPFRTSPDHRPTPCRSHHRPPRSRTGACDGSMSRRPTTPGRTGPVDATPPERPHLRCPPTMQHHPGHAQDPNPHSNPTTCPTRPDNETGTHPTVTGSRPTLA